MKSLIASILVLGVVGMVVGVAARAQEASISATVTVKTVAVSVDPTSFNYGIMIASGSKRATTVTPPGASGIVAKNDSNVDVNLGIRGGNATGVDPWTLASTLGTKAYTHEFSTDVVNFTSPSPAFLTDSSQPLASGVGPGGEVAFDLRITLPTSPTAGAVNSIPVTVIATE